MIKCLFFISKAPLGGSFWYALIHLGVAHLFSESLLTPKCTSLFNQGYLRFKLAFQKFEKTALFAKNCLGFDSFSSP